MTSQRLVGLAIAALVLSVLALIQPFSVAGGSTAEKTVTAAGEKDKPAVCGAGRWRVFPHYCIR
jgi:hypothetical protein